MVSPGTDASSVYDEVSEADRIEHHAGFVPIILRVD